MAPIREALCHLPDARKGGNNQCYTMGDAGLSAFSVFFMQSPSFLDFQVRMKKERGRNNATTLFGVHQIPSTPQICNLRVLPASLREFQPQVRYRVRPAYWVKPRPRTGAGWRRPDG